MEQSDKRRATNRPEAGSQDPGTGSDRAPPAAEPASNESRARPGDENKAEPVAPKKTKRALDEELDEELDDSFPASDPPSLTETPR
jgi:hypothetical protein